MKKYVIWCVKRKLIKDTLKAFHNFKTTKKVNEVMLFDMEKYIYSESLVNTLYIELRTNVTKIFFRENKRYKCTLLSFASSNSSQFYSNTQFVSLKPCAEFSIFQSVLFYQTYYFGATKSTDSFTETSKFLSKLKWQKSHTLWLPDL